MRNTRRSGLAVLALLLGVGIAPAHYNILLPGKHSIKKDESVTLLYRWGHPFEHQLFDAPEPEQLYVIAPDGQVRDLSQKLEKIQHLTPDKKTLTAYQTKFKPSERGDYTFVMRTPPIFLEEDGEFVQDEVKVVLHVQAQKNWDADLNKRTVALKLPKSGLFPLTRPYGLQPGTVFQAQFFVPRLRGTDASAASGALVEVERFNPTPPKKLPPDEFITRTCKTDPNGVVTCTLFEAGWWCITAQSPGGMRPHNGKDVPVRLRSTLWVYVDEKMGN